MPDREKDEAVWCVLLLNDDATPMEFVVHLLQQVFQKSANAAKHLMLDTHNNGIAVCSVFARREEATAKIAEAESLARQRGYPLELRHARANASLWRPPSPRRRA